MPALNTRPILVVEDSQEDFDTVREAAQRIGLPNDLVRATDADGARHWLHGSVLDDRSFAFMLLDQSLPGTNGDGLIYELRAHPVLSCLPVVVLSGSTRSADVARCYYAGANAYHTKSVRFDEHVATVLEIFRYWLGVTPSPHRRPAHFFSISRI
jgi:CheY-like chemotaxis protein